MRRLTDRFGYRGTWLLIFGALWIVFGIAMLSNPERPIPGALHQYVPYEYRAVAWIVTGVVAIAFGLRRSPLDAWGHVALVTMPLVRALGFGYSWLLSIGSALVGAAPPLGYPEAWYLMLIWLFITAAVRHVAGWPEPTLIPDPSDAETPQ